MDEQGSARNEQLGRAVKERMAGRNYREVAPAMGLHHATLYDLAKGLKKSEDTIRKFARYFGESETKWLRLAGFEVISTPLDQLAEDRFANLASSHVEADTPSLTPQQHFGELLAALSAKYDRPVSVRMHGGWARMKSLADAEREAAAIEADILAEIEEERNGTPAG